MVDHSMKVAGIDTSKTELAVCLLPDEMRFAVANDDVGIAALVERCRERKIERAGIEATSIYHKKAAAALRATDIAVAELQPRQARSFAQALLKRAKSDDIDAYVIARLTQALDRVSKGPDPDGRLEPLAEALTFIEQLEERIAELKTRLERYSQARYLAALEADIHRLEKQRRAELRRLEAKVRKDVELRRKLDLLLSIPTVAERTALAFLIRMPELGTLSREEAASLAGLAPMDDRSGKREGERHIAGGRSRLRKTVYMAAFAGAMQWNAQLKSFYGRLRLRGKAHTSAIVACARKLVIIANAVLARGTPWQEERPSPLAHP